MSISIQYLQDYLKKKDYKPDIKDIYFMKLCEEVGELSRAMIRNLRPKNDTDIKDTIEEELWDIMYYVICIANIYDIELEKIIPMKEEYNNERFGHSVKFDPN